MAAQHDTIFFPLNYSELFSVWEKNPDAVLFAGGTGLIREQWGGRIDLPPAILSLEQMEEMRRISRSERYLEIGAMVSLSRIIALGKIVPKALRRCLVNIAGPQIRNMATLGGNICFPHRRLDCSAALTALDAQYELRTAQTSRWIAASRFSINPAESSELGIPALNQCELLTRIRIPLEQWDYSAYKKFAGTPNQGKAVVFLAKIQKNILSDIRVIYKSHLILRNRNSESVLIGKRLPVSHKIADEFIERWESFLSEIHNIDELAIQEPLNYIAMNAYNLSD